MEQHAVTALREIRDKPSVDAVWLQSMIDKCACKACGVDGVSYEILKAFPHAAIEDLRKVIEDVEHTFQTPQQWRAIQVALLTKKPTAERPIALTSVP